MMEQLLTMDDVAFALQVKKSWLYDQTRLDLIPHMRLGKRKHIRFLKSEIEMWLRDPGSLKIKSSGKRKS